MKFPLVLRSTHDAAVKEYQQGNAELAKLADAEYDRAMDEGKRMVREWAVEANYNLYVAEGSGGAYQAKVRAALQDAIGQFRPRNWRSVP